jgi:hypothetical protein
MIWMLLLVSQAWAHPLDLALLEVDVGAEHVAISLEVHPSIVGSLRDARVSRGGEECSLEAGRVELVNAQTSKVTARADCRGEGVALEFPFMARQPAGYRMIYKSGELIGSVGPGELVRIAGAAPSFIGMGIAHIGADPREWDSGLPEGIDHILFVVALVLASAGWMGAIRTVTGFTIGHSLTLALGTLGLVSVPSRWVETAIALSIAGVAFEAIRSRPSGARVAVFFGMIHGLGFASALTELELSRSGLFRALLGFNLGVEIGQALVVLVAFPLVLALRRTVAGRRFALPASAAAILVLGCFWAAERAIGT